MRFEYYELAGQRSNRTDKNAGKRLKNRGNVRKPWRFDNSASKRVLD